MDHLVRLQLANNLRDVGRYINQNIERRRFWIWPWLQRQPILGMYEQLVMELEAEDPAAFKNFIPMEPAMLHELLNRFGQAIANRNTWYHKSLYPGSRLAITLHFLATYDSYHSLMFGFRVAHNTISMIVRPPVPSYHRCLC